MRRLAISSTWAAVRSSDVVQLAAPDAPTLRLAAAADSVSGQVGDEDEVVDAHHPVHRLDAAAAALDERGDRLHPGAATVLEQPGRARCRVVRADQELGHVALLSRTRRPSLDAWRPGPRRASMRDGRGGANPLRADARADSCHLPTTRAFVSEVVTDEVPGGHLTGFPAVRWRRKHEIPGRRRGGRDQRSGDEHLAEIPRWLGASPPRSPQSATRRYVRSDRRATRSTTTREAASSIT